MIAVCVYRILSWQSLSAWTVAGAIYFVTMPRQAKEMSKKEVEDANRAKLFALAQSQKPPDEKEK